MGGRVVPPLARGLVGMGTVLLVYTMGRKHCDSQLLTDIWRVVDLFLHMQYIS